MKKRKLICSFTTRYAYLTNQSIIWSSLYSLLFAEVNITRPENERDDIDHKCLVQVRDPAMLYMSDNPNNAVSGKWKKSLL